MAKRKREVDVDASQRRDQRVREAQAFAETMHSASLPEPFRGAVTDAVRGWTEAADAALWHEVRAEVATKQAQIEMDNAARVRAGDTTHPDVAALVERVTSRTFEQIIVTLAAQADVPVPVMAVAVGALGGNPVPPALREAVWALLERTATNMDNHQLTEAS